MPKIWNRLYLFALLIFNINSVKSQKYIAISDSLAANSERLNVKLGSQGVGKLWKMRFGDYAVVSSKLGWQSEKVKANLFNTKIETKSTQKFSFLLSDRSNDTARVDAANNIFVKALQELAIFPNFSWGSNELINETQNFSAFIVINGDTSDTWALLINTSKGTEADNKQNAFLTNGVRTISVYPVISKKKGNSMFSQPVAGYECMENTESLCAVQYIDNMGWVDDYVWLRNGIDHKMKLVLAAAMTTLLQLKINEFQNREQ